MNKKEIGDMGCNCVIGELAKYGVGVAFPLSDNYPFDIIALAGNSLFKVQVKSSSSLYQGAIAFKLTTSNFHNGKKYNYGIWLPTKKLDQIYDMDSDDEKIRFTKI